MDRFFLKVCNKDPIRKYYSIYIANLKEVSVQQVSNGNYVTELYSEQSCSPLLRDAFNWGIENASKVFFDLLSFGAPTKILHKKECPSLLARYSGGQF